MESLNTRFQKEVFEPYRELLKAKYRFHRSFDHAKRVWESKLTREELINGPYLEQSKNYRRGDLVDNLPLHEETKTTIKKVKKLIRLWKHQSDAIKLIIDGHNTVIATGTSSGKTLCYQIPILDDLVHHPSPGLRAIIIYPLNALVNDQLEEWELLLREHSNITFARFTGQTPDNQKDYENKLKDRFLLELEEQQISQQEKQRKILRQTQEQLRKDPPNKLNHREAIRSSPPNVLVTNFSMLEYLLERPIDVPIFENAQLKFIVLDEVHAYRGVQATEIAFLLRRLKDRLGVEKVNCIATSATLGKSDDPTSHRKVRDFATELFGDTFDEPNPIHGVNDEPNLETPSFSPTPIQYMDALAALRKNTDADIRACLGMDLVCSDLSKILFHDANLHQLRKKILEKPSLLVEASKLLWPGATLAEDGLQAFLEIIAIAKKDNALEDILPTRLHYFIRAQDGLYICLHKSCPARVEGKPAFFVSRKNFDEIPDGECPECYRVGLVSKLVELVSCRKCGYLYGALQDLGPRRAQDPNNNDSHNADFDSFSTELGWIGDSFWSYFSVDDDLPYPAQHIIDDSDEDENDLAVLEWCAICGRKKDEGKGDNCRCEKPHLRTIKIFHRQCPYSKKAKDRENLYKQDKHLLGRCPNCGARNSSGIEPVQRFQESDDELGLAMAIPFAHFQCSTIQQQTSIHRKLLCFTDNRQKAAAFPSHLEEETFAHDMGRKIVNLVNAERKLSLMDIAYKLLDITDRDSKYFDPDFFLPVSRFPDERVDQRTSRNLWIAETLSYFGIPDSARESAEDFGFVTVEYNIEPKDKFAFQKLFTSLTIEEASSVLQVLLTFIRQKKAFTLPDGVTAEDQAFGHVKADISFVLKREGDINTNGWLPHGNRENMITSYLQRLLKQPRHDILKLSEKIWFFLIDHSLLFENKRRNGWKLGHELLYVRKPTSRFACDRCGYIATYNAMNCCPRIGCIGSLRECDFDINKASIIEKWVSGNNQIPYKTLKSEEHTAQINKDLAKSIEDDFRYEGINLLSSTTTFEMGINIGDLQKILLRNPPPTSSSYIQRVGRAGRGKDKNSICVTLCRRTKYDADSWKNPLRLMTGDVKTPTVFTQNKIIAQRHFNAVLFAKFLRQKIYAERLLKEFKQQIRLEPFLPLESRTHIPWQKEPSTYLDFCSWLEDQKETNVFQTSNGRSLILSNFEYAKSKTSEEFNNLINIIATELSELLTQYRKLQEAGKDREATELSQAIKNLLGNDNDVINVLAKRGFLPRYAFPLDVVTLETGSTRWSRDTDVELSRDRSIAIAEFAPGAQVIAHKKVFTSSGLYVVSKTDEPRRKWYSKCSSCEQIRIANTQEDLAGKCSICQTTITKQFIYPFVEPRAFSISLDQGTSRHRRNSLVRLRQTLTHFIDNVDDNRFQNMGIFNVAITESGKLFKYNRGPKGNGFVVCSKCGFSVPVSSYKPGKPHKRLRGFGKKECENPNPWGLNKGLAYGHEFHTFCLIVRSNQLVASTESLAFALQRGICAILDLDSSDIGVSWRWLANKVNCEIILYDNTPGGAGFVKETINRWDEVLNAARTICTSCNCESSCYDCLKSYYNQSHHEKLDRHKVVDFLSYGKK